ncbi:MAG: lyase family protein [Chloroflexia bacterium]
MQNNVLYAANSRGKIEAAIVHALAQSLLTLSKLAQDVLLFTTSEYGFFTVSDSLVTGSSIMPQKKNISMMELVRAKASIMLGYQAQIMGVLAGLPSGYNKDYQETKRPFMDALYLALKSFAVVERTVSSLTPNEDRLLAACTPELYATDRAYELVRRARPSATLIGRWARPWPTCRLWTRAGLRSRTHTGSSGNLGLDRLTEVVARHNSTTTGKLGALAEHWRTLLPGPTDADRP